MKVQISDYSDYVSGRSSNGGQYGFWTIYEQASFQKNGEPAFFVSHHTTADFEYCEYCGRFGSCDCDQAQIITLSELQKEIAVAQNDPSPDVEVKYLDPELKEIDWKVVRRRIEDALRKTATETDLITIASVLSCKIFK